MKRVFQWKKRKYALLELGTRILLGIGICAAAIFTVYIGRKPYGEELKEGDICLRTIYAPITFNYRTSVDEKKTKVAREEASQAVSGVYDRDPRIKEEVLERITEFFARIIALGPLAETKEGDKLDDIRDAIDIEISEADLKTFLSDENSKDTRDKVKLLLDGFLEKGIVEAAPRKKEVASPEGYVVLRDSDTLEEAEVSIDDFLTLANAKKEATAMAQNLVPENRKLRVAVINLSTEILQPNITFNEELTAKKRKDAYDKAPMQYKEKEVKKQELIIARGKRVGREHLLKIKELFRRQVKVNRFMFFLGAAVLALIFLIIIVIYLKTFEPKIFLSTRKLTLIGVLFVLILAIAKVITYSPLPSYSIPTAIAAILIALLIGPRIAIIISIALSIFVGIIAGDKLNITTVSFIGCIVGIFFIRGARRRSQILITGCLVGIANFVTICGIELLHGLKYAVLFKEGFWGIINGLGSAIIVTGFLPVFEYLFNMVTNISLLELSDLNHPLLKDMVIKAPGTYHHSLIVGNLAEAACNAIGSNALLARVGSYFHDIGKTEKAEYFSENQMGQAREKHDKLTPSMSSLIITNHVKDGVELARKYKLNQEVIDFIEQHHGSSLIYYFYQRALEKTEDDQMPKEEGFRYPGPKPQTKETAVVLLADSVEAASRTLNDPTPARVKGLVSKLINNKFIDNQLDQCDLTLRDLEVIGDTFARILMGVLHSRVEYETGENKNKNKKHSEKNTRK
jgi:putative nucleotidyltransferase with HDIG domain